MDHQLVDHGRGRRRRSMPFRNLGCAPRDDYFVQVSVSTGVSFRRSYFLSGNQTSRSFSSTRTSFFFLVLVLFLWLSFTDMLAVATSHQQSIESCDLAYCWELFQSAQETLRVPDDFAPPSGRHRSSSSAHVAAPGNASPKCITSRTFYLCLRNMSRTCLGDLSFHSANKGVERQMKQANCSAEGPTFTLIPRSPHSEPCSFKSTPDSQLRYCAAYPHLRTFSGTHETCHLIGAWPLIDNQYMTVQLTIERIGTSALATAITKVTIVVKRHDDCALDRFVTYQASSNDLPATFDDGSTTFGTADSISIKELIPNSHVRIALRYIGTTVDVRQVDKYLSVSLLVPASIVNESTQHNLLHQTSNPLQLCIARCPLRVSVDVMTAILERDSELSQTSTRKGDIITEADALSTCRSAGLVDYYLDGCVYDQMYINNRTNDALVSLARHACNEARLLGVARSNRTALPAASHTSTAAVRLLRPHVFSNTLFSVTVFIVVLNFILASDYCYS